MIQDAALTAIALCVVFCYRIHLIHKFRMRRLREINIFMKVRLPEGHVNTKDIQGMIKDLDAIIKIFEDLKKYDRLESHALDLTKWTYEQFFPLTFPERR